MSLTRRDFVARSAAVGAAAIGLGGIAGCADAAPSPLAERLGLESRLLLYTWSDYLPDDVLRGFERATGVRVVHDTYESSEEMLAKLLTGGAAYDVVIPVSYGVEAMIATRAARALDPARLPNMRHLAGRFLDRPFDPGNRYSVPYLWGVTGIAYRSDRVPEPPASWRIFLEPARQGRMTMLDDPRDVIGSMLRLRGRSINTIDAAALGVARTDCLAAKANLRGYKSAPVKADLLAGDVWIAQLWDGDTRQAAAENPAIRFALPHEGGTIWLDSLVIPAGSRHPNAAHAFIDHVHEPAVAAAIAAWTGYRTPNVAAAALATGADVVPDLTPDELGRLEFQSDLGRATETWDRIWTEIKAG